MLLIDHAQCEAGRATSTIHYRWGYLPLRDARQPGICRKK